MPTPDQINMKNLELNIRRDLAQEHHWEQQERHWQRQIWYWIGVIVVATASIVSSHTFKPMQTSTPQVIIQTSEAEQVNKDE